MKSGFSEIQKFISYDTYFHSDKTVRESFFIERVRKTKGEENAYYS